MMGLVNAIIFARCQRFFSVATLNDETRGFATNSWSNSAPSNNSVFPVGVRVGGTRGGIEIRREQFIIVLQ